MPSDNEPDEGTQPPNEEQRDVGGIFDRFVDNFLGLRRGRADRLLVIPVRFENPELSEHVIPVVRDTNADDTALGGSTTGDSTGLAGPTTTAAVSGSEDTNTSHVSDPAASPGTTATTESTQEIPPATPTEHRTIIITVNFVFSDSNNPQNPNRQGSLIMSLPNNPLNRDPRAIQEFIRLATQMAYLSILNDLDKEQGISLSRFNGFPGVKDGECEKQCPICFDEYKTRKREADVEVNEVDKRRCTGDTTGASLNITNPTGASLNISASTNTTSASANTRSLNITPASANTRSLNITPASANNIRPILIPSLSSSTIPSAETLIPPTPLAVPGTSNTEEVLLSSVTTAFAHNPIKMPCGHVFGKSCLFEWLKTKATCPLCRASVAEPRSRVTLPAESIHLVPDLGAPEATPDRTTRPTDSENSALSYILAYLRRRGNGGIGIPIPGVPPTTSTTTPSTTTPTGTPTATPIAPAIPGLNALAGLTSGLPSGLASALPSALPGISSSNGFTSTFGSGSFVAGNTLGTSAASFADSLFGLLPTGVASRRTPSGVVTTSTDLTESANEILDFLNLHNLVGRDGEDEHNEVEHEAET